MRTKVGWSRGGPGIGAVPITFVMMTPSRPCCCLLPLQFHCSHCNLLSTGHQLQLTILIVTWSYSSSAKYCILIWIYILYIIHVCVYIYVFMYICVCVRCRTSSLLLLHYLYNYTSATQCLLLSSPALSLITMMWLWQCCKQKYPRSPLDISECLQKMSCSSWSKLWHCSHEGVVVPQYRKQWPLRHFCLDLSKWSAIPKLLGPTATTIAAATTTTTTTPYEVL